MRTKFLLSLCLAAMPVALTGCDGGGETQVGTGMQEPPPEAKAQMAESAARYEKMMQEQRANPTPVRDGVSPPPAGD